MHLCEELSSFLSEHDIRHDTVVVDGHKTICACTPNERKVWIIPVQICSTDGSQALIQASGIERIVDRLEEITSERPIIIAEDRWRSQQDMIRARILAHLEKFSQVYARNCEVRKIDKVTAADFLKSNHSYGDAACRYRYGLYLKRHTGHNAQDCRHIGELIAVCTFSNARKWIKGDKTIRSYEWTRYASLPGLRINGGMGRLLKTFINDIHPDDVMTYADLEWSDGKVYERLGFTLEDRKSPILFEIDATSWCRKAKGNSTTDGTLLFQNFGSNKYRLKLTEYR